MTLGSDTFDTPVVANPSGGFSGWIHQTHAFTATSTSECSRSSRWARRAACPQSPL